MVNSRQKIRLERLHKLKTKVSEAISLNIELSHNSLISQIVFDYGVEVRKAREDVKSVIDLFDLEVREGKICSKKLIQE